MLAGDFLQLPPVKTESILKPPDERLKANNNYSWYLAGYELFQKCNFCVFLTENMRQREDKQFQDVLERMHWGVNNQDDVNLLNTRCIHNVDIESHYAKYTTAVSEYFSPIAIATNKERCSFNRQSITSFAFKAGVCVYEILAHSSKTNNCATIQRLKNMDDDFTGKIPFLLTFHTSAMPAMITKRVEMLNPLGCIANGTIGFIIGFIHDRDSAPCLSPNYRDDDSKFHIKLCDKTNVPIKRFKTNPSFILFKVRGCKRVLVQGYPEGVVAIPLSSFAAKFTLPSAKRETSMSVSTFPIIPAYAMTPEKLQGITLENELYVPIRL
jgi:hypothetical protein